MSPFRFATKNIGLIVEVGWWEGRWTQAAAFDLGSGCQGGIMPSLGKSWICEVTAMRSFCENTAPLRSVVLLRRNFWRRSAVRKDRCGVY